MLVLRSVIFYNILLKIGQALPPPQLQSLAGSKEAMFRLFMLPTMKFTSQTIQ